MQRLSPKRSCLRYLYLTLLVPPQILQDLQFQLGLLPAQTLLKILNQLNIATQRPTKSLNTLVTPRGCDELLDVGILVSNRVEECSVSAILYYLIISYVHDYVMMALLFSVITSF